VTQGLPVLNNLLYAPVQILIPRGDNISFGTGQQNCRFRRRLFLKSYIIEIRKITKII